MHRRKSALIAGASAVFLSAAVASASAETVAQALASAYINNPEINSARAQTRVRRRERADRALRTASRRLASVSTTTGRATRCRRSATSDTLDTTVGLQVTQNLFSGFRVTNAIRQVRNRRAGEPRAASQHRPERALRRGAGLHGCDPRRRDSRHPAQATSSSLTSRCARPTNGSMSARIRAPMSRRRVRVLRRRARRSASLKPISRSAAPPTGRSSAMIRTGSATAFPYGRLVPAQLSAAVACRPGRATRPSSPLSIRRTRRPSS